jgi:hypothetical protein
MFLNATRSMSFKNTKNIICGRLELNYNDVEIYITWRCFVGKHQYFPILIACDVDFRNMMEMPVQSGTNMMELYVSSQPKRNSSYNMEYRDTNISMPIFYRPFRQLSHLVGVGTSRTLEDRIIEICDENRIKTAYYNQHRYDSFDSSDNENKGVRSLVETSDGDSNDVMRPPVPEFGSDTGVDGMVYNDWFIFH